MDINLALQYLGKEDNNYRLSSNAPDGNATIVFWDSNNSDSQPTATELATAWTNYQSANPSYNANIDPSPSTGIADDSVTTAKIVDDAVTTDKLADSINTAITANTSKLTADATNVASAGAVMDGDFTSNGFMKRTGSGTYEVDASTYLTSIPSSYLQNLSEDTTPQLGGDLDMNSKFISSGILGIKNTGTQSELRLYCETSNAHYASIKAPAHADFSGNITYTLPSGYGSNGQVLKSDGSGGLDWVDQNTVDSTKMPLTGGTFTGSVTFEDAINENVYAITDGNAALDPDNGTIQTWTLGANRTASDSLTAGQSMLLVVTAGSYTLTFPTTTWAGGSAPTLSTSKPTAIEFWKIGTTLYGAKVGDLG